MLSLTQLLIFELGKCCNLGGIHPHCPNRSKERFSKLNTDRELDDLTIVQCATRAYSEQHFQGLIGWHYYNEPLVEMERMFRLMAEIKEQVPESRFILWTNGTLLPADCERFAMFDCIVVTRYKNQSYGDLNFHPNIHIREEMFDRRMDDLPALGNEPCLRSFVECIVDCYGNHHPCCNDWRGESSLGNIYVDGFDEILRKWREFQEAAIVGNLPPGCQRCGVRYRDIQAVDRRSIVAIAEWIATKNKL
jgi:hypothetical protein